jgi:thiamine biosynthesis protein ThiS
MLIQLNGEDREVEAATVAELVERFGFDPSKVAVERNLSIVPRSLYGATRLEPGDRLELVTFVGGG